MTSADHPAAEASRASAARRHTPDPTARTHHHLTRTTATAGRRWRGSLVALLGVLMVVAGAAPAQAAGYRYWSFWKGAADGSWAYQQQGPSIYVPPDGSVDGWRFAVSPDGGQDAARPRLGGGFDSACAGTPPQAGRKRVAVVLDSGTAADAPSGEAPFEERTLCAVVPPTATSAEVLASAAAPLRYDSNGLLCAISGYPKAGCAEQLGLRQEPATPAAGNKSSGPDLGLVAGGALVVALAAGAVWQARRRRHR
ncbi:SCO2322 family protein [Kitasatospora aureofaciens]|uniref:SCO2322 family protein n=1 Tax=Kitasatospora aureofaciens TaxID=1894 RepID=UPI0027E1FF08|nr:SCO2322 family protein [Kitasatospora aureofaciens]